MALLEVEDLTMRFGGLLANNGVALTVEEGEIVGLIGPNGAGKTTLFNCISGYYSPTSGSVRFQLREIAGLPAEEVCRRGMTRTFQIVRVLKDMTVLENVMVGALLRTRHVDQARAAALEMLEMTGLAPRRDVLAGNLTIAEKKRLELTRVLATRPKLLLLDEVMAGLTPTERVQAVDLVRRVHAEGITILMVEHVMEVIMPVSNRVVVLDYGVKIAEDVPERVVRNEDVIKAYLGERYRARS